MPCVDWNNLLAKFFALLDLHSISFDRSRSRSRSRSPSYSRRHARGSHAESNHRSKAKPPRVEYITEFGGSEDTSDLKVTGISPPSSPKRVGIPNRSGNLNFNICNKIHWGVVYPLQLTGRGLLS
jgi:hypothetical protein